VLSVDNPVAGVGPVPPGHFDVILASTSSQTLASPPFVVNVPTLTSIGGATPGVTTPSSVSLGGGPSVAAETLTNAAANPDTFAGAPANAVGTLNAVNQRGQYKFNGIPAGLILALLLAAAIAARFLRRA